jgi:integrase
MARGSIVKKGSSYYIVYRLDGKQTWKSAGPNKKKAERMLTEIMAQIHTGGYQETKEITFKDFSNKWLADYSASRVKTSTHRFYKDIVDLHLTPHFGRLNMSSITTHMIEEFLAKEIRETSLSPTTIGYHLRVMKTILKRAIIWGYLTKNPAEYIQKPRIARKEMDFLTPEELRIFLANTEPEYYPLFLTAALTGLRRGELLALKWSDINWATNQIHVRRSLVLGRLDEPKSKTSIRALIVPPMLISELKKHHLSCPIGELDLVFPNKNGDIMNADNLYKRHFLMALRRAGLRKIRFHDLRHTYTALLISQGENLKFIQQQLGHSSIQVTLDRYGHLMPQVQEGAGERLQESVFGNSVRKVLEDSQKTESETQDLETYYPSVLG